MGTVATTKHTGGGSPRLKARIAGLLYLVIFIAAPSGAATATPARMIVTLACDTGVALIFYDLLKPVSRSLSLLAALFRIIFVAVMAVNTLSYFGAVVLFQSARSPSAFNTGYEIAMVPFGLHCLLTGYLLFQSTFFPRFLGVLMALAGLGYLTFLWPPLGSHLFFPWIVIPGIAGEGSLTLWLLVIGVNVQRWKHQTNAVRVGGGPSE
ncbi:MAG: DUF4386 domain-containing protein [Terracidiphilus sp.]